MGALGKASSPSTGPHRKAGAKTGSEDLHPDSRSIRAVAIGIRKPGTFAAISSRVGPVA